jgi:hypothetical protein
VTQATLGKRCLLVVDEAQNLSPRAVEELRMLSNFQYGQQALLQTFLVGQPEFRAILQSPAMQQLRQRVTATCHIGPMDAAETQGYISHRLQHAGSTDKPVFEAGALEAVFNASGGIPRRINQVCDRLLLAGYLGNKHAFASTDVQEVVAEMREEFSPSSPVLPGNAGQSQEMVRQIGSLGVEQHDNRLRRLELSMLRLERMNLQVLLLLQKLVASVHSEERT